jgi:hypothetical protein
VGLVVQVILAEIVPAHLVVAALAIGQTVGTNIVAIPFVIVTRRVIGPASVQGVSRATFAGLIAATGAGLAGYAVSAALPAHHKLVSAGIAALATVCTILVFAVIAIRLDGADLRVILGRFRQSARMRRGQTGAEAGEPGRRSGPIDVARQRRPGLLNRAERQVALAIGAIAGGAGLYAVFASSNRAGAAVLLLVSVAFLLVSAAGTPFVWHLVRPGAHMAGKRRLDRRAQAEPTDPQPVAGIGADITTAQPILMTGPAVTSPSADDGSSLYTAE